MLFNQKDDSWWGTLKGLMLMKAAAGGGLYEYEVTGNPVSFNTNVSKPLKQLLIPFAPVQAEGTPSPENPLPISGWNGFTVTRSSEKLFTITDESVVQGTLNSSTGAVAASNYRIRTSFIKVKPDTTYTVYANVPYLYIYEYSTDSTSGFIKNSGSWENPPKTFKTSETTEYIKLLFAKATSTSGTEIHPSDLTYCDVLEDGVSVRIPITFPAEAGTVYGGTLDVTTGVLTVDMASVDLGSRSYTTTTSGGITVFRNNIGAKSVSDNNQHGLTSIYPFAGTRFIGYMPDKTWMIDSSGRINIRDDSYSDASLFANALSGQTLVYELAEPIEYQLTPQQIQTLVGDNVVYSDTNGENTIKYLKKG